MSEAKFTQGPWHLEVVGSGGDNDNPTDVCEVLADRERICEYVSLNNARLIAAGPAMYEELASILQSIEGGGDVVTFQPVDVARYRALLALARGEKK